MEKNFCLEIEDFGVLVADSIKDKLGDEVSVEYRPVTKNNGVIHHAVLIRREGENISPTIYIDYFYDQYKTGMAMGPLVDKVIETYRESMSDKDIDVSFFMDFAKVSEHLAFRAVNYEKNKEELDKVPYKRFEDLAFVPVCVVDNLIGQSGTVVINNIHLKLWEISEDELWENVYEHAEENFPVVIKKIEEFVSSRTGIRIEDGGANIFVISNSSLCYGASSAFFPGVMQKIAKEMKTDVLIIPSSVHETIALPSSGNLEMDRRLIDMVKEVNETTLASEEILSDNVYYYNAGEDSIASINSLKE